MKAELLLQAARRGAEPGGLENALAHVAAWQPKPFPLSGSDVLALGLPAGPEVGDLLRRVEAWWLDGDRTADRDACLAELQRIIAPPR